MKIFLTWLMRSRSARVGVTAALGLMRLFEPLSGGVVALTVLRYNWREGAATTLIAMGALLAVEALLGPTHWWLLALPTCVLWGLVFVLALVLRRTASLALVIQLATLLGCIAVVAVFAWVPDPAQLWLQLLSKTLKPVLEAREGLSDAQVSTALLHMAQLMTGVVGASVASTSIIGVLLGRWAQAALDNPGGFRNAFCALRMGRAATIVGSLVFVLTLLVDNLWLANLAIVVLVMFVFQGLAVVHGAAGIRKLSRGWLVGFYIVFALAFLYMLAIVAGAGLVDNWFNFRARLARNMG